MTDNHLIGIVRNEFYRIQRVRSSTNRFQSERNLSHYDFTGSFGEGWIPERVMMEIPLYLSDERILDRKFTEDYKFLPRELTDILHRGLLRTSGVESTDYSILMSVTEHNDNRPPEGRTGVLLYKGELVTVNINDKDFVVEIKGVGCPDGDNKRTKEMIRGGYFGQSIKRFGSATESEGRREFDNLELQRDKSPTFLSGEAIRAVALFVYKNDVEYGYDFDRQDQAYLIRLAPGNVRSSFNQNPDFPKTENREIALTTSVGRQYAELARLEQTLLHSTIHPENIVKTGIGYVLTDFADCRRLDQIVDPYDFISKVFDKIREVPGITPNGENNFYFTIANGLGVEWNPESGYSGFIEAIWSGFFAQRVYNLRKGKDKLAQDNIEAHRELLKLRKKSDQLHYLDIKGAKTFLEREINMLKHIREPDAAESLRIANQRVAYLASQLADDAQIQAAFKQNPNSFYDLFLLPYMRTYHQK